VYSPSPTPLTRLIYQHPQAVLTKFGITHVLGVGDDLPIALAPTSTVPRRKTKTAAAEGDQYEYQEAGVRYMVLAVSSE